MKKMQLDYHQKPLLQQPQRLLLQQQYPQHQHQNRERGAHRVRYFRAGALCSRAAWQRPQLSTLTPSRMGHCPEPRAPVRMLDGWLTIGSTPHQRRVAVLV